MTNLEQVIERIDTMFNPLPMRILRLTYHKCKNEIWYTEDGFPMLKLSPVPDSNLLRVMEVSHNRFTATPLFLERKVGELVSWTDLFKICRQLAIFRHPDNSGRKFENCGIPPDLNLPALNLSITIEDSQ